MIKRVCRNVFMFLGGLLAGMYLADIGYHAGYLEGYAESTRLHKEIIDGFLKADNAPNLD